MISSYLRDVLQPAFSGIYQTLNAILVSIFEQMGVIKASRLSEVPTFCCSISKPESAFCGDRTFIVLFLKGSAKKNVYLFVGAVVF